MNNLEKEIQARPVRERPLLEKSYKKELDLIRNINFAQSVRSAAEFQVTLMEDRKAYLKELYSEKLGIDTQFKPGGIKGTLLQGPHSKDPEFFKTLADAGLDRDKIYRLNRWYDSFLKECLPLQEAKAALEADPENVILQKEFKKIADDKIHRLSSLSQEFKTKLGGKKSLQELESAINTYKETVSNDLGRVTEHINNERLAEDEKVILRSKAANYNLSLKMLVLFSNVGINIDTGDKLITAADQMRSQPLSGILIFLTYSLTKNPRF